MRPRCSKRPGRGSTPSAARSLPMAAISPGLLPTPTMSKNRRRSANSGYAAHGKGLDRRFSRGHSGGARSHQGGRAQYAQRSDLARRSRAQSASCLPMRRKIVDGFERALAIDPERSDRAGSPGELQAPYFERPARRARRSEPCPENRARAPAPSGTRSALCNPTGMPTEKPRPPIKKAIELDPLDPVGHANLALLYLDRNAHGGGQARDRRSDEGRSVLRYRPDRPRPLLPANRRDGQGAWRTCWPARPPIPAIPRRN